MKKPQVWHYHYDSSGHARKHLHFGGRVRHEHVNLTGYGQFTSTLHENEKDADKRRVKYFGRSTPSRVDAETAMNPGAARHRQEAVSLYKEARGEEHTGRKAVLQIRAAEHVQSALESEAEGIPNPKFRKIPSSNASGTFLIGYIHTSYDKLVATFGKPNGHGDEYKVRVEWVLKFGGYVVTIYDWKESQPISKVTEWHIGGHFPECAKLVADTLGMNYKKANPGAQYHKTAWKLYDKKMRLVSGKRKDHYQGMRDAHQFSEVDSLEEGIPNPSDISIANVQAGVWETATLTNILKQLRQLESLSGGKALDVKRDRGTAEVRGNKSGKLYLMAIQTRGGWLVRWDGKLIQRKGENKNPEIEIKCAFCGKPIRSIRTAKLVGNRLYHPECLKFLKKAQGVR